MHENKIFFCCFFIFLFCNISEKIEYFNTGFVSYIVKIQINIKQNW